MTTPPHPADATGDGPLGTEGAATGPDGTASGDLPADPFAGGAAREGGAAAAAVEDASPLATAERQRDEFLEALRRLQADFENYRKRVQRQQEEQADRVAISLVEKILPALDALDLALLHLDGLDGRDDEPGEGTGDTAGTAAREGLVRVATLLSASLAKEGLERIDPLGEAFDPNRHEAVGHAPAPETAPGGSGGEQQAEATPPATGPVVSEVLRAGYQWKGRVLRPAMVNVEG